MERIELACRAGGVGIWDDQGKALRILGTNWDIAELLQNKAESAQTKVQLQASEGRYRNLIENFAVGVVTIDLASNILYCNESTAKILEFDSVQAVMTTGGALHYASQVQRQEILNMLATTDRVKEAEIIFQTRNGNEVVGLENAVVVAGKINATIINITSRKRFEQDLKSAKALAENANPAKSIFLSNMSHELRTPPIAILGLAHLMNHDQQMSEENKKRLDTINRASPHLLVLINDVLEISRIESGSLRITKETFDLYSLLTEIDEIILMRAQSKGITFQREGRSTLPQFIEGDASPLKQVLINLLGSAVKYTEQGGVAFWIRRNENEFLFEITDTEPGIDSKDFQHIFQPFFQTDVGVAKGDGVGFGLSISQEFARLTGGELTKIIRALSGGNAVKIIALTASVFEEDRQEILAVGCDEMVRKLVLRIAGDYPALGIELKRLVGEFQFEKISSLLFAHVTKLKTNSSEAKII